MDTEAEEEILALGEIFQSDYAYLGNTGAWGAKQFSIECRVSSSTTNHTYGTVSLLFTLPKTYPKASCQVRIKQASNITSQNKQQLERNIQLFCQQNTGRVMCYDLVQTIQDFLLKIGPMKAAQSFYDAMKERESNEKQNLQSILDSPTKHQVGFKSDIIVPTFANIVKKDTIAAAPTWIDNDWLASILKEEEAVEVSEGVESNAGSSSRYAQEFLELSLLGKGASGEVCKCKNRLDGRLYAIKKIHLEPGSTDTSIYREVRCISGLLHKHIVRYYSAWIEIDDTQEPSQQDSQSSSGGIQIGLAYNSSASSQHGFWKADPTRLPLNLFPEHDFVISDSYENSEQDEGEEVEEEEDTSNKESSSAKEHQRFLYIQMEFCKATLKPLIDQGGLSEKPSEVFHLLRQILEALAYIHKQGVVHRDLKPANIFLDQEGNIRVGDFGLATSLTTNEMDSAQSVLKAGEDDGSLTVGVGTALYRAPEYETMEMASRERGDKADMFSLGIILFEMMHKPFDTGMERVKQVMRLRDEGWMPEVNSGFENLKKIVILLVNRDPSQRPSAAELLKSPLIPPRVGIDKSYLNEIMTTLMDSANQDLNSEIISTLFKRRDVLGYGLTSYDYKALNRESRWLTLTQLSDISHRKSERDVPLLFLRQKLEELFSTHAELFGGVRVNGLLLRQVELDYIQRHCGLAVELLEPSGRVLSLPTDLISSFARYSGRGRIQSSTVYSIDRVYTSSDDSHPIQCIEAAFAITSSQPHCDALLQAECLSFTARLLRAISSDHKSKFIVRVGDSRLAEAIFDLCEVSENTAGRRKVRQVFSHAKNAKELFALGLGDRVSKRVVEFLHACVNYRNAGVLQLLTAVEKVFHSNVNVHKLKKQLTDAKDVEKYRNIVKSFSDAMVSIRDTMKLLYGRLNSDGVFVFDRHLFEGVNCEILLDLGLTRCSIDVHSSIRSDKIDDYQCFTDGLYFTIELCIGENHLVCCEGGHFEPLIYAHRPPSTPGKQLTAIGVRFSIDKLLRSILKSSFFMKEIHSPLDCLVIFQNNILLTDSHATLVLKIILDALHVDGIRAASGYTLNQFIQRKGFLSFDSNDFSAVCERLCIPYLVKVNITAKPTTAFEASIRHIVSDKDDVTVHTTDDLVWELSLKSKPIKIATKSDNSSSMNMTSKAIIGSGINTISSIGQLDIVFVDRSASVGRDKGLSKHSLLIEERIRNLIPNSLNTYVLVSDNASVLELRDFGTIMLKHFQIKSNRVDTLYKSLENMTKDSKVFKSLKNILTEIVKTVSRDAKDFIFIFYHSESDQFDVLTITSSMAAIIHNSNKLR